MYNRDIETNREAFEQHNANQKKIAAERLAQVAAKMKMKRKGKAKGSKDD